MNKNGVKKRLTYDYIGPNEEPTTIVFWEDDGMVTLSIVKEKPSGTRTYVTNANIPIGIFKHIVEEIV